MHVRERQAICGWSDRVRTIRMHRTTARRALAKLCGRVAWSAFSAWRDWASHLRSKRLHASRCLRHMRNRALSSAFSVWCGLDEKRRMRRALLRISNVRLSAAFASFREALSQARSDLAHARKVLGALRMLRERQTMSGWS